MLSTRFLVRVSVSHPLWSPVMSRADFDLTERNLDRKVDNGVAQQLEPMGPEHQFLGLSWGL